MSVCDNLKVVKASLSDEDIVAAFESVSLHQWIMSLPVEYESFLQKHGKNMSGGGKDRDSLLRKPSYLMLELL